MMTLETQIDGIIRKATVEVAATVRVNILAEIHSLVGGQPASIAAEVVVQAPKMGKKASGGKHIAFDESAVVNFVKRHSGKRTEEICAAMSDVDRVLVKRALHNARKGGIITSDGVKRAMTWSAAK